MSVRVLGEQGDVDVWHVAACMSRFFCKARSRNDDATEIKRCDGACPERSSDRLWVSARGISAGSSPRLLAIRARMQYMICMDVYDNTRALETDWTLSSLRHAYVARSSRRRRLSPLPCPP